MTIVTTFGIGYIPTSYTPSYSVLYHPNRSFRSVSNFVRVNGFVNMSAICVLVSIVETCNQKNREGRTERAEHVAENKRKTYA